MTEFQIASAIKNYVTSNYEVTDSLLSIDQIRDEVNTLRYRNIIALDFKGLILKPYNSFTQSITVSTVKDGNYRVAEIPNVIIANNGKPLFGYVGGSSVEQYDYRILTGNQHQYYKEEEDYITSLPTARFVGTEQNKLVFLNKSPLKVRITAVFAKPSDLEQYGYDPEEDTYPLPANMIDEIIGKTANSYLRTMYRIYPQANKQADTPNGNVQN